VVFHGALIVCSRAVVTLANRPALAAALLYAGLALVAVAPALVPGHTLSASDYLWGATPWEAQHPADIRPFGANPELADSVAVFQPFTQALRARAPDVPLWNPHIMAGRPFLGNAQSAVFSPFTLPSLLLPFWWSLGVVAALKLWCAAFGTFLLARALGQRAPGALLAGLAFGFGLYFVTWLSWPLTSVWALLPWLLLAVDGVVRAPRATTVALLALVVALGFFGGHPESSFHCMVAAALFAVLRSSRAGWRRLWPVAIGLAAGTALAAIALLPFLELLRDSGDLAERAGRGANSAGRKFILGFALPEYWGRPTQSSYETFINVRAFYAGALPLLLAALGLVLRPTRERVGIALAGVGALLVVFGVQPLFRVVTALPGFAQAHNTRLTVIACLALALLAGWGLDELTGRRVHPSRRLVAFLAAAVALPIVVVLLRAPWETGALGDALAVAWGFADLPAPPRTEVVAPMASALVWIVVAGLAAALIWAGARGRLPVAAVAALALGLTAADLLKVGIGQNPAIPVDHAEQPVTGAIRYLQEQRPARFAGLAPDEGIPPLPADVAMRYGLYDARGYDYPVERRYDTFWKRAIAPPTSFSPPTTMARFDDESLRALGLLGVTDLLQRPADRRLPLGVAYDEDDARIYANPHALPRAWVAGRTRQVEGEDAALDAVLDPDFDARQEVIVERPIDPGPGGTAEITSYEPERVRVESDAEVGGGVLVLSDVFMTGWHATVDGREAPVERVDYLLRGVRVPEGRHEVEFTYRPAGWRAGVLISALAALALLAAVVLERRRR
jgi:Bacterial membrane protein YfhO